MVRPSSTFSGGFGALPPPGAVDGALAAFLELTTGELVTAQALRALTLHMLQGHAPGVFERARLRPVLEGALRELTGTSISLFAVDPDVAMARVDAWYVRREQGLPHADLHPAHLRLALQRFREDGAVAHAWLLGELAASRGIEARLEWPERPLRDISREVELYGLTHEVLLATRYLRQPLGAGDADDVLRELILSVPWILAERHVDLGAEVAFCLQCAGRAGGPEHAALLELVLRHQREEGDVVDPSSGSLEADAHCTAAALLALAGAEERRGPLASGPL